MLARVYGSSHQRRVMWECLNCHSFARMLLTNILQNLQELQVTCALAVTQPKSHIECHRRTVDRQHNHSRQGRRPYLLGLKRLSRFVSSNQPKLGYRVVLVIRDVQVIGSQPDHVVLRLFCPQISIARHCSLHERCGMLSGPWDSKYKQSAVLFTSITQHA